MGNENQTSLLFLLQYYFPMDRGLEQKIQEKLKYLRERDKTSTILRYK